MNRVRGVLLLSLVAIVALLVGSTVPFVTPLVLAIALGAVLANVISLPEGVKRGLSVHSLLLETAIVLLGVSLSVDALINAGPLLVSLVLATVAFGIVLVTLFSRFAKLNDRLESLLAAGSSICGVSAIAAVAPAIDADDTQIAHAAATILLFDVFTLVAFPPVGRLLDLDGQLYGIWIGLAMFSTGPVAAAGFAHSTVAGQWATLTKLSRNALIGAVAMLYSFRNTRQKREHEDRTIQDLIRRLWTDFPKFLIGFLLLAILANSGVLSDGVVTTIGRATDVLFLLAFAGLGFEIQFEKMRQSGIAPIAVVGFYLLIVSGVTYATVILLF